jgi:hypothetical protein
MSKDTPYQKDDAAKPADGGVHPHPATTADSVFDAIRMGSVDAAAAAEKALPAVKQSISKGAYMLCYYLAFGAVYSAALAMEFVPQDSVIRHGFRDGAEAARTAHKARSTAAEPKPATT